MISEDEAYEKALDLHPEFQSWEPEDFDRAERKEGVNWHLHLRMDAVVFRRISDSSLPDARVIAGLEKKGKTTREAIHEIARIVTEDIWERLRGPDAKSHRGKGRTPDDAAALQAMNEKVNQRIESLLLFGGPGPN